MHLIWPNNDEANRADHSIPRSSTIVFRILTEYTVSYTVARVIIHSPLSSQTADISRGHIRQITRNIILPTLQYPTVAQQVSYLQLFY